MKSLQNRSHCLEVLDRLAQLQPGTPARWGRMTAHQALCHLSDSFRMALGEKNVSVASNAFQRTFVKWFALNVPLNWPQGVATRPEVEPGRGGTPPSEFARDRAELAGIIERFSTPGRSFQEYSHPTFGRMKDAEWLRWGYLHADHHLRQFGV